MSATPQSPHWFQASDGKWYPPAPSGSGHSFVYPIGALTIIAIGAVLLLKSAGYDLPFGLSGQPDRSAGPAQTIREQGAAQLQQNATRLLPGSQVTMDDAQCVETSGTQSYNCIVTYTLFNNNPGIVQKYQVNAEGTCDSHDYFIWHTTGNGSPIG